MSQGTRGRPRPRRCLPAPLTVLVDREDARWAIRALLLCPDVRQLTLMRLLTLTGPLEWGKPGWRSTSRAT
jgi:hypothetical protein